MKTFLRYLAVSLLVLFAVADGTPWASAQRTASSAVPTPPLPIVFVHGNGDDAAKWIGVIWLFESNGYPSERLFAIRFTMPVARGDDSRPEPARSSTGDEVAELSAFVSRVLSQTGSRKVVLVGSSRGGLTIRNYILNGGGKDLVDTVVLAGTPNHGVMAVDTNLGNEFNGKGAFLRALNHSGVDGPETVPGIRFFTLRSDRLDKYAQPAPAAVGNARGGMGVGYDGPELKGATNEVLANLDHRELAFASQGFRAMYRCITGHEPQTLTVRAEAKPVLSGLITGFEAGVPTNQGLAGVTLRVIAIDPDGSTHAGAPVYQTTTGATGEWGPVQLSSTQEYEFDLEFGGRHVRYFKAPLMRSSKLLNLRLAPVPVPAEPQSSERLLVSRPQGYLSRERDPVLLDGAVSTEEPSGLPTQDAFVAHVNSARPVRVRLRSETIAAQPSLDLAKDLPIVDFLW